MNKEEAEMIMGSLEGPHASERDKALALAFRYGGIDGAHHKAWVIDQMIRALAGSEERYRVFIAAAKWGEDGPDTYEWDEGVAP